MTARSSSPKRPQPLANDHDLEHYFQVLDKVEERPWKASNAIQRAGEQKVDIEQEIARRQQLENNDFAQNIKLKRKTLNRLFWLLAIETTLIFLFSLLQGVHWPHGFRLEDWSFKLLVSATIAQITGMLYVAVRYLFPKDRK